MAIDYALNAWKHSNFVNKTIWDFYFNGNLDIQFKVESLNIPREKFVTETHNTSQQYYTGYEPVGEFNIIFKEDTEMSVYKYFDEWKKSIYNENREFISLGENVAKGSPNDTIHRTGIFILYYFPTDTIKFKEIFHKLVWPFPLRYTPQVIGKFRNFQERLADRVSNPDFAGAERTRYQARYPSPPFHITKVAATPSVTNFYREYPILRIEFKNMKFIGIDALDFDYVDTEPLKYSVTFSADEINFEI